MSLVFQPKDTHPNPYTLSQQYDPLIKKNHLYIENREKKHTIKYRMQ